MLRSSELHVLYLPIRSTLARQSHKLREIGRATGSPLITTFHVCRVATTTSRLRRSSRNNEIARIARVAFAHVLNAFSFLIGNIRQSRRLSLDGCAATSMMVGAFSIHDPRAASSRYRINDSPNFRTYSRTELLSADISPSGDLSQGMKGPRDRAGRSRMMCWVYAPPLLYHRNIATSKGDSLRP